MPGPYLTAGEIEDRLAAVLNLKGGRSELEPFWLGVLPSARQAAYGEIVSALVGRGYTVAQIDTWDRRAEFQEDLSLWWALVKGEAEREGVARGTPPASVPQLLFQLDRRAELLTVVLTAAGVLLEPPADAETSRVATGDLSTARDVFQLDPRRPNPWEPGYEYRR